MVSIVKTIASSAVVSAGLIATSASAATVAIDNGSFERPGTFSGSFQTIAAGGAGIDGWTVGGAGIDHIRTYWTASDLNYSLDMNAGDAGSISQQVNNLTVGTIYEISFDMAGNPDRGPMIKKLMASMDGFSGQFGFDITGQNRSDMGWERRSFKFGATSTSALLTFAGTSGGAWGPALDNVSIAQVSGIPVPASLLMFGTAIGALGIVRSRRPRKRA